MSPQHLHRPVIAPPLFNVTDSPVPNVRDVPFQEPLAVIWSPDDTHTHEAQEHQANLVVVQSETMLRMSSERVTVFDSGCSISGTCNITSTSGTS